jgi:integrase
LRYSCINLKRHLGDLPVERLSLIEQTAYMAARRKEGAQGASARYRTSVRPLADGTLIRELGTLRTALRWAVSEKWFIHAPGIKLPNAPPPRHRWLTRDEARRLLANIIALHAKTFVGLALFTGARSGAILQLPWANVDFVAGTVNLGQSRGKKKRATVPMTDELRVILETAQQAATTPWVIEYNGKPIKSAKTGFLAAAKRAGITGVSPHTIRHTAASWMVQAGVSYQDAGHWLGMSPDMVRSTYGHHHPDYLRNAAAALRLA